MNRESGTRRSVHRGRPRKPTQRRPTVLRRAMLTVRLPRQTRSRGGKTKLTNHRAALILHAISCGCYRETAAELAGVKAETLSHWMGWTGEPYDTFQRLVRKAEANLEARMVGILTAQAEVKPEMALAILERKFPQRWAKVTVVAASPPLIKLDIGTIMTRVAKRVAEARALGLPVGGSPSGPVDRSKPQHS